MTPRCPICGTEMPTEIIHNQQHTCTCGAVWLVIKNSGGKLKWLQIGGIRE